ncbi:hypothetical protein QPI28_004556 [Vibrio parahaemolyticus]|nr:hypothetical protein [Vibrio parahaemolyticus]ELA7176966.1 hypothetical protein [Vibrio parahaemolyticus]ELA7459430.1 hypothetical protein [Vibrio parahaemolyticus]ELA7481496.1 hypothetical protein [Vibrio parahaemolyticus]ELA7905892.1 hypothetical protein [Vibrio parahaemolyticus]
MIKKLKAEIGKIEKLKKRKKFKCLHPNCNNFSIGSHSQQRGGQLSVISRNSEVYAMDFNMYKVLTQGLSAFSLKKTRIKNASIYPGFCEIHDGKVFAPIEKQELIKDNSFQAATFFLRTVTYEITRKKLAHFGTEKILESCSSLLPDAVRNSYEQHILGREKFINHDLPYYYKAAFDAYNSPDSGVLQTKWIVLPKNVKASSCTAFSPISDFKMRMKNQETAVPQFMSSFNLVPTAECTHVIVSWLSEHSEHNEWINHAMENEIEKFINYVAICESEDICFGPELWDAVDIFTRERVYEAMAHEVHRGPLAEIPRVIKI